MRNQASKQKVLMRIGHERKSQGRFGIAPFQPFLVFLICWKYYFSDSNTFSKMEEFLFFVCFFFVHFFVCLFWLSRYFILTSDSVDLGKLSFLKMIWAI